MNDWVSQIKKKSSVIGTDSHMDLRCWVQMNFLNVIFGEEATSIYRNSARICALFNSFDTWVNKFPIMRSKKAHSDIFFDFLALSSLLIQIGVWYKVNPHFIHIIVNQILLFEYLCIVVENEELNVLSLFLNILINGLLYIERQLVFYCF